MDKLDLIIDKINDLKESHNKRLDSIDNNLDIHMKRSDELEHANELTRSELNKQVELINTRITTLEEPRKFIKYVYKSILIIGSIAAAVFTAIKLYTAIKGA